MRISDWSSDVCSSDLIDDLVAAGDARRLGVGGKLIDALREEAQRQDCAHFVLDTALGNALGQRFSCRQGLLATGRSEERRVGQECVSTCRSRWSMYH